MSSSPGKRFFVAVHAGAGQHAARKEPQYKAAMIAACRAAEAVLQQVTATVITLSGKVFASDVVSLSSVKLSARWMGGGECMVHWHVSAHCSLYCFLYYCNRDIQHPRSNSRARNVLCAGRQRTSGRGSSGCCT